MNRTFFTLYFFLQNIAFGEKCTMGYCVTLHVTVVPAGGILFD
jgi:hypothetical protein